MSWSREGLGGLVIDNNGAFSGMLTGKTSVVWLMMPSHPALISCFPVEDWERHRNHVFVFLSALNILMMDKVELEGMIHHQINPL